MTTADGTDDLQVGGVAARVTHTGLAVVHAGELILPAAGSEAQAERVADDSRTVVHYHFPVEVEVRAAPDPPDPEELLVAIADRMTTGLENA